MLVDAENGQGVDNVRHSFTYNQSTFDHSIGPKTKNRMLFVRGDGVTLVRFIFFMFYCIHHHHLEHTGTTKFFSRWFSHSGSLYHRIKCIVVQLAHGIGRFCNWISSPEKDNSEEGPVAGDTPERWWEDSQQCYGINANLFYQIY